MLEGITELVADTFVFKCLQTLTGVKFLLGSTHPTSSREQDAILAKLYDAYADFVSKNPFQENEMPIKSDLFSNRVEQIFKENPWINSINDKIHCKSI